MAFNAVTAAKMVDNGNINDKEISFLLRARDGVTYEQVKEDETFAKMKERGFVQLLPLSHPRTLISISAVVPTEDGVTVLNMLDQRFREAAATGLPTGNGMVTPEGTDPTYLKNPTHFEKTHIPELEAPEVNDEDSAASKLGDKEAKGRKEDRSLEKLKGTERREFEKTQGTTVERVLDGERADEDNDTVRVPKAKNQK